MSTITIDGTVKKYAAKHGYGFVVSDSVDGDVFIHASIVKRLGTDRILPGDTVRIEATQCAGRWRAVKLLRVWRADARVRAHA